MVRTAGFWSQTWRFLARFLWRALGAGAADGFERVWLSVERWNEPAISLYEKVGFRASDTESFEHEMAIRLADQTESTG